MRKTRKGKRDAEWASFEENRDKLRELILYIARRSENDPGFGMTKLNKLLFYCDFLTYAKNGRPITGAEYQRLPNGPALRSLLPIQQEMERLGECAIQERDYFGYPQRRLVALRNPNLAEFSGDEIALVERVLEKMKDENAMTIANLSHEKAAWLAFKNGETIRYTAIFVSSRPLSEAERKYATSLT